MFIVDEEPTAEEVNAMSSDEVIEAVANMPEEEEEGEETPAGQDLEEEELEEKSEEDDAYAFLDEKTGDLDASTYNNVPDLVAGYKEIQGLATKLSKENAELRSEISSIRGGETAENLDDFSAEEKRGLTADQLNNILDKRDSERDEKNKEVTLEKEANDRIERHYEAVESLEGFKENEAKVYGIIQHFPLLSEIKGNPFKLALEMAKNPDLMRIYNSHPNLLEMADGGFNVAQGMLNTVDSEVQQEEIEKQVAQAKDEGIKEQADVINASVGSPSPGNTNDMKTVENMTREEVFEALGYKPDKV